MSDTTNTDFQDDPKKLSVKDFAAKIKAKYPDYGGIDDSTLVQKIVDKYPNYKEQVDFGTPVTEKKNSLSTNGAEKNGTISSKTSENGSIMDMVNKVAVTAALNEPKSNGLIEKGNIDLRKQPSVHNTETGGESTVWSTSFGTDKGEVLVSRVTPDGKILSEKQALEYYKKTGKHLGIFKTVEGANAYAEQLHKDYESGKYTEPTGAAFGDPRELAKANRSVAENTQAIAPKQAIDYVDVQQHKEERAAAKKERIGKAVENTVLKSLQLKGIKPQKNSAQFNREKAKYEKAIESGDAVVATDKDGQPGLKRTTGALENLRKGWHEATKSADEANKFVNEMTDAEKVAFLQVNGAAKETEYIGERPTVLGEVGHFVGSSAPFLGKAAAGAGIGAAAIAAAPETLGASLAGLPLALSFMTTAPDMANQGAQAEIIKRFQVLKNQNPNADEVELMKQANAGAIAGGVGGILTNAALMGTGLKTPLSLETKNVIANTITAVGKSAIHMGAIGGAITAAQELEGELEGIHTTAAEKIKSIANSVKENATTGAMLTTLLHGVPKILSSAAKYALKSENPKVIEGVLKANENAGNVPEGTTEKVVADINSYNDALSKVASGLSPESEASVAGLIQKRTALEAEAATKDKSAQAHYTEQTDAIDRQIADIQRTNKPFEHEIDEVTGKPYVQPTFDDVAKQRVEDLADKIAKGKRIEDAEDLQTEQNFPDELEKALNKIVRQEKSDQKDKENPKTDATDNINKYQKQNEKAKKESVVDNPVINLDREKALVEMKNIAKIDAESQEQYRQRKEILLDAIIEGKVDGEKYNVSKETVDKLKSTAPEKSENKVEVSDKPAVETRQSVINKLRELYKKRWGKYPEDDAATFDARSDVYAQSMAQESEKWFNGNDVEEGKRLGDLLLRDDLSKRSGTKSPFEQEKESTEKVSDKPAIEKENEKTEKPIGKYAVKAKEAADKIRNADIPQWLINTDPNLKKSGVSGEAIKNAFADAVEKVGELIDKGIEVGEAIKKATDEFVEKYIKAIGAKNLKPDFEAQVRTGFENHYRENVLGEKKPPPLKEPVTEGGTTEGAEGIGITHADTKEMAEQYGFDTYEKDPQTIAEWDAEAATRIADGKMPALIKKMERGDDNIDHIEQRMMGQYIATLDAELSRNPTNENLKKLERALVLSDEVGGRQAGRALKARQGTFLPDDSLGKSLLDEKDSLGIIDLPEKTKEQVIKEHEELTKIRTELAETRKQNEKLQREVDAKQELAKIRKAAKKGERKTHDDFVKERTSFKDELKAAKEKHEKWLKDQGIQKSGAPGFVLTGEMAKAIGKIVKSHAEETVMKFDELVQKVFDEAKEVLDGLSKSDIVDVMAGVYTEKLPTQNELAARLRDFKAEATLLKKLSDARLGKEPKTQIQATEKARRIVELERKIKEIRKRQKDTEPVEKSEGERLAAKKRFIIKSIEDIEADIRAGRVGRVERQPPVRLDKKTQALQDRLIQLESQQAMRRAKQDYDKMSKAARWSDTLWQILGLRRFVNAAVDFSILFRQAAPVTMNLAKYIPIKEDGKLVMNTAPKAIGRMFNLAFDPNGFKRFQYNLEKSELGRLFIHFNGVFSNPTEVRMEKREEEFTNSLLARARQKIAEGNNATLKNVASAVDKAWFSERAAAGLLNTIRIEEFSKQAKMLQRKGITPENSPEDYKASVKWVMNITGRGNLLKLLEDSHSGRLAANRTYFGARLMGAKINMLNPFYYAKMPKEVRVQALKDMAGYTSTLLLTGLALQQAGAAVSMNPDEPDFLQVRFGDKVFDISGGSAAYVRTFLRVVKGVAKQTMNPAGKEANSYTKFMGSSVWKSLVANKLSPNTAYAYHFLTGKSGQYTESGKLAPFDPLEILKVYPLYVDGTIKAFKDGGMGDALMILIPDLFGIGTQQYEHKGGSGGGGGATGGLKPPTYKGISQPKYKTLTP